MELARRTRWLSLSLPLALAGAAMLARPAPPGAAAAGPMPARDCPTAATAATAGAAGGPAWYRMDPQLDAGGTLVGQTLTGGRGSARWTASLPPESFASGPVGGRILVGDDDGERSRLRVLDTAGACWSHVGTEADVIRSALLAPDGASLYEHRVDRASREDRGVWVRDLRGSAARPVVAGPVAGPPSDRTFATSLLLDEDGRLAVSACGQAACRTSVIDVATRDVALVVDGGPALGIGAGRLIVLDACHAMPCAVNSVDIATGAAVAVGETSGAAALSADGSRVVVTSAGGMAVSSAAGRPAPVAGSAGLAPILRTSTADSGFAVQAAGLVAVAPEGRATDPALVRLLDPASLQLTAGEVLP